MIYLLLALEVVNYPMMICEYRGDEIVCVTGIVQQPVVSTVNSVRF